MKRSFSNVVFLIVWWQVFPCYGWIAFGVHLPSKLSLHHHHDDESTTTMKESVWTTRRSVQTFMTTTTRNDDHGDDEMLSPSQLESLGLSQQKLQTTYVPPNNKLRIRAISNIYNPLERKAIMGAITLACQDYQDQIQFILPSSKDHAKQKSNKKKKNNRRVITTTTTNNNNKVPSSMNNNINYLTLNSNNIPFGATGRVVVLEYYCETTTTGSSSNNDNKELLEILQYSISQEIDSMVWGGTKSSVLKQPVLIHIILKTKNNKQDEIDANFIEKLIHNHVEKYKFTKPMIFENTKMSLPISSLTAIPTLRYEVDGAMVIANDNGEKVWDTSSIVAFDGLVSKDLRRRLLNVINGRPEDNPWNESLNRTKSLQWKKGGLMDIAKYTTNEDDENDEDSSSKDDTSKNDGSTTYGLTPNAIHNLCNTHHDAIQEMESTILTKLFPQFHISRFPGDAILGEHISPLTANAVLPGEIYQQHIDADPALNPPSPYCDIYGIYPNRCWKEYAKPRFMSVILYLNEGNNSGCTAAPTRFWDVSTNKTIDINPIPAGRIVWMDQDITHSIIAPPLKKKNNNDNNIPRYSIVWKLILHPKYIHQDMTKLEPDDGKWKNVKQTLIGSAAAGGVGKHDATTTTTTSTPHIQ